MGAFLEGFREPMDQEEDPEVMTSLSYDSEDEEGGDDEVIEALSYAGVAHRDWYGRRNGSSAAGEEADKGGSSGRSAAVNLGWTMSGYVSAPSPHPLFPVCVCMCGYVTYYTM